MTNKIIDLAAEHPQEALNLLRHTSGACRIDYLCQVTPATDAADLLIKPCQNELIRGVTSILGCSEIPAETWRHITLPVRMGVRNPEHSAAAAYLACMVNMIAGNAMEDTLDKQLIDNALREYSQYLGAPLAEKPTPAPKLQKDLTELVYKRNQAALLDAAAARDLTRLQSVLAPHATAWIDGSGMLPPLTAEQYRCALKWVLGIPLRRDDYCCTACGTIADKWGEHTQQ